MHVPQEPGNTPARARRPAPVPSSNSGRRAGKRARPGNPATPPAAGCGDDGGRRRAVVDGDGGGGGCCRDDCCASSTKMYPASRHDDGRASLVGATWLEIESFF